MIDANQIQKQKDEMFRLEVQVIHFLISLKFWTVLSLEKN